MLPRQQQFCCEYLIDLNATQAAIRAGYSPRTARVCGPRLLHNAAVQAEIARLRRAQQQRTGIQADRVIEELARIALARIDRVVECRGRTVKVKSFAELPADVLAAVESVHQTRDGIRVKLHAKTPALEQLMRHLGQFERDNEQQAQMVLVAPVVRLTDDDGSGTAQSGCDADAEADAGLAGPGRPTGA